MAISHISPRFTATNDQPSSPLRTTRPLISKTVQLSSPLQKHPETKSRKKEFPSVAKLLDGISFQDETHPDFFLRASRFKPRKPILHPSELILPRPSSSSRDNLIASHPLTSPDALPPATVPACSSSSIPLLLQRTCDSTTTTSSTSSFSPRSPADSCPSSPVHHATVNSLKRVYTSSSEEDDESDNEEDGDDEESEEKNSTRSSESSDERTLKSPPAFGLGIVWQTGLGERGSSPESERPIARPSRTWLTKTSLDRASPAKSSATSPAPVVAAAGGDDDAGFKALIGRSDGPVLGLVSSRSVEIRQNDKRRRFLHGVRFHQVIR